MEVAGGLGPLRYPACGRLRAENSLLPVSTTAALLVGRGDSKGMTHEVKAEEVPWAASFTRMSMASFPANPLQAALFKRHLHIARLLIANGAK
jgi:hypothetical protein